MEKSMSRMLVETVVKKALKSIKDSPERGIRNLVDMALQFSEGRFQKNFFTVTQTMFQNENSAYYGLVRDVVAYTDSDRLFTFGMNLGYNSCTEGARQIRENEKKLGCNIPWTVLLQVNTQQFVENQQKYSELIREGESLGIYTWMVFPTDQPQKVFSLAEDYPDSAFCFFCEKEDVTPALIDEATECKNLMLVVHYDENTDAVCEALRERGLLYSVWYQYGQKDTEIIINGDLFSSTQQLSPIFTVLLPEKNCPEEVRRLVYQEVKRARSEQNFRTLTWELQRDNILIDSIISEDDCSICFDKDGNLCDWNEKIENCNLFQNCLAEMLIAACPKEAGGKHMNGSKIGIVDVGGGYRGVYATGVLDYCMDHHIQFDLGIGVSAGSANLISYAAGQRGRNYQFYTEYGLRKEYASIGNFLFKKSFVDLDYVYSTLSNSDGENPLDYPAAAANPMEYIVVATEAETGNAKYFDKSDIAQDDYSVLKASSAIPFVCHPYAVGNTLYYDGALGDTIPIQKAFQLGCDKVVLLLTLPEDTLRTADKDRKLAARIRKKYPLAAQKLEQRAENYNNGVALAQKLAAEGKVLIVAPDDTCGVSTLSRDADALRRLYEKGYQDGKRILDFLKNK